VSAETYRLVVSPTLPAIPLFTLAGFLLAEGGAPQRLLRLVRALVGWFPGGTAVVATLLCALFTVFTGGSGVTILALGALVASALAADGYQERFSLGLITASGSLGLLLPPALPLILYGIVAGVPIEDLFRGGLLPGLLLIGIVAAWAMREGVRSGVPRQRFTLGEVGGALWAAKWELAIPITVATVLFSGIATVVESAAVAAALVALTQLAIHRDIPFSRLLDVLRECLVLVGGVLVILGVALGLTSWMVDAEIPAKLVEAAQEHLGSKLMFLLALTLFLLIVGCLMDIFSAIIVVAPLLVPLGEAFGIHPVQLGIIFIANLELGYLTPPVGLNLFLASYRFDKPLWEVARAVLPFLLIRIVGVLLVTLVPALTLVLL
jgi:tripartite ATP-independent transporter DctM subunit